MDSLAYNLRSLDVNTVQNSTDGINLTGFNPHDPGHKTGNTAADNGNASIGTPATPSTPGNYPLGMQGPNPNQYQMQFQPLQQLNRTSSLIENMGVQRASSPFLARSQSNLSVFQNSTPVNSSVGNNILSPSGDVPSMNPNMNMKMNMNMNMHMNSATPTNAQALEKDWFQQQYPQRSQLQRPNVLPQQSNLYSPLSQQHTPVAFNNSAQIQQPNMAIGSQSSIGNHMGMAPPPPPHFVITESQWKYIDPSGQLQGPFRSSEMTTWYHLGYLASTLEIARVPTSPEPFDINDKFIKISDLIEKVHNAQEPFQTFDFIVAQSSNISKPPGLATNANFLNTINPDPALNVGQQLNVSQNIRQQQQQQQVPTQPLVPLPQTIKVKKQAVDAIDRIESPDYNFEELLNLRSTEKDNEYYYRETTIRVPVNRHLIKKLDPNENVNTTQYNVFPPITYDLGILEQLKLQGEYDAAQKKQHAEKQENKPMVEEDMKSNTTTEKVKSKDVSKPADNDTKIVSNTSEDNADQIDKHKLEEKRRIEKANEMARKLLEEQEKENESKKKKEQKQSKKQKKKAEQKLVPTTETETISDNKNEELIEVPNRQNEENNQSEPQITTKPAPWANKNTAVQVDSIPTIEELQKLKQSKKKASSKDPDVRNKLLQLHEEIMQEERSKEKMTSVLKWADKSSNSQPSSSIDLKEQVKNSKKNRNSPAPIANKLPTLGGGLEELKNPTFIEEQKQIWEQIQKAPQKGKKTDITSSLLSSNSSTRSATSTGSNPWKTVASQSSQAVNTSAGTPPVKPVVSKANSTSTSSVNSLNRGKQIGSSTVNPIMKARQPVNLYPGNSSISARQEFIKWCKTQLKLKQGVNAKDVLEVLLSLPAGLEAKEIIADTIYSYSATMDGRRFATEFISKRLECESQIKDPLNWSEVLALPEGSSDDWEFQVVTKKKTRKY